MSTLKLFLLAPNLELIGKLVEETDSYVVLEQTLIIRPVPSSTHEFGLQMVPISPTTPEGKQKFQRTQLLAEVLEIPAELSKVYRERTSDLLLEGAVAEFEKLARG